LYKLKEELNVTLQELSRAKKVTSGTHKLHVSAKHSQCK